MSEMTGERSLFSKEFEVLGNCAINSVLLATFSAVYFFTRGVKKSSRDMR